MNDKRIKHHPILDNLEEREECSFTFDGKAYKGHKGDTIASALLANGVRQLRVHEESGTPRGIYCNIGHCFECRVTVNGKTGIRACMTKIEEGMSIESGKKMPEPLDSSSKEVEDLPQTYADFMEQQKTTEGEGPDA